MADAPNCDPPLAARQSASALNSQHVCAVAKTVAAEENHVLGGLAGELGRSKGWHAMGMSASSGGIPGADRGANRVQAPGTGIVFFGRSDNDYCTMDCAG
jgi:hypothetical protein